MEKKHARRHQILPLLALEPSLSRDAVARVAAATGVPEADVYGAGSFYELLSHRGIELRICEGLSCQLAGADELAAKSQQAGTKYQMVSCLGQCDRAPVAIGPDLQVELFGRARGGLSPSDDNLPMNLAGDDRSDWSALEAARSMGPERMIEALKTSGLQGRGGAGFPTHFKWSAVRSQPQTERYVVINADEGEPGTFKDRELMLRRPRLLVEGAAIAAHTVGAQHIYLYVRGEFPAERAAVEAVIQQAGAALQGLEFHFVAGHGAYICGEETALLESIEGRRGMPRLKPPYPTEQGLWGKPTLMNNVETLACVPSIVLRGGQWFREQGRTEPGSKLYCLSGHVQQPGVYELPLGACLDDLLEVSGGVVGTPLAFSPGGASSGFLPMDQRRQPLDFKGLATLGSMLGSAGVVVVNDTVDPAELARMQALFFERESCGQCAPCRLGARYLRQSLDRYLQTGKTDTLRHVDNIAWEMDEGSICGLGMTAALPLTSLRRYFPQAFIERKPRSVDSKGQP